MSQIESVRARQILDSRGNPTVEVEVPLVRRARARRGPLGRLDRRARSPRAPRRRHAYGGKGVTRRSGTSTARSPRPSRPRRRRPGGIDGKLIELDGTDNKSSLGANAILGVSLAVARAAAAEDDVPLWRYLGGDAAHMLPVPMLNVLNGGAHADNSVDFQEFMLVPVGAPSFAEASDRRRGLPRLKSHAQEARSDTAVGDEGGFAPDLESNEAALELLIEGIEAAGYKPGDDVGLALDPAVSARSTRTAPTPSSREPHAVARPSSSPTGPTWPPATRSSRSRTAWPRTTGTAGRRSPRRSATGSSSSATTSS